MGIWPTPIDVTAGWYAWHMTEILNKPHTPWKNAGARAVVQPFPYQGSKRILAPQILSLFPNDGPVPLVEPFAGSAAISVASRHYGLASDIYLSDVNAPLIALWQAIIDEPAVVIEEYTEHWLAQQEDPRAYFLWARDEFNKSSDPVLLLYLLCRVVKAAVRYSKDGRFNQSADHRRLGARPSNMKTRIMEASRLMQGAKVQNIPYESPLVDAVREAIVYMDPPYQGTTDVPDHRYLTGLKFDPFVNTLQNAVDNQVSFVVSYDVVTDDNKYGVPLPRELGLLHRHVEAGLSSQATLQGKKQLTVESLYISPALVERLGGAASIDKRIPLAPPNYGILF